MTEILAIDVFYDGDTAHVAGVSFNDWPDSEPTDTLRTQIASPSEYEPGEFYKRELPCIAALLEVHDLQPKTIIVDGFVYLGSEQRPGLGKHLYDSLHQQVNVIGVAKNPFRGTGSECEVYRGGSIRPLYVTSVGIPQSLAKEHILAMHGRYRFPTMLSLVDAASKAN